MFNRRKGWSGPLPALGLLLLLALAVRLYYVGVTRDQAVWWDEAEYLLMGRQLAGIGTEGVVQAWRPIGLPLGIAGFFAFGFGEMAIRLALVLASLLSVWLTYRIGERILGATAAWVGAALFSVCYLPLFYTFRILTEIPHLTMALLAMSFYVDRAGRFRWLTLPVLIAAACIRVTDVLLLGLVAAHWAAFEAPRAADRRRFWVVMSIAVASIAGTAWVVREELYSLWGAWDHMFPRKYWSERWLRFLEHVYWLLRTLGPVQTPLMLLGIGCWIGEAVRSWRAQRSAAVDRILLLGWIAIAFLPFAAIVKFHDRYLILALPPMFLAVGYAAVEVVRRTWSESRRAAFASLALITAAAGLPMLWESNRVIHEKADTFADIASAGRWLRAHTTLGERIFANSAPQVAYYSERDVGALPESVEALRKASSTRRLRFAAVSTSEPVPDWLRNNRPSQLGWREAARFPSTEPAVLIYEVGKPRP